MRKGLGREDRGRGSVRKSHGLLGPALAFTHGMPFHLPDTFPLQLLGLILILNLLGCLSGSHTSNCRDRWLLLTPLNPGPTDLGRMARSLVEEILGASSSQPDPPGTVLLLSHPLQASLTWFRTPTTCRHPHMCNEPTCTPCAARQRRSAWPGKEQGMKHETESLGRVHGSHPEPGKVAEPLRALPSILPGSSTEERGRDGSPPAYVHSLQDP